MEVRAKGNYIKGSPQKAGLVVDMIRGKRVGEALAILMNLKKRAAHPVEKVLRSAIANAEERSPHIDVDELVVSRAFVGQGPTKWKWRMRPAPMGRAYRERRRSNHITIYVSDNRNEEV